MVSRYFPSGLYLWQIIFAVVLVFLPCSTGKPNFHPVNSCTDIKLKEIPVDVLQECTKNMSTIHCLPDESNNLGLSCFKVTWISKGKCPSYNSYQGNMDEKDCSTVYNGTCPSALFQSPLSLKYTGCYIKELKPVPTTTTPTTPLMTTMTTKTPATTKNLSSDPTANVPITAGKRTETNQTDVVEGGKGWMIAFFIILVFAFALIAANCVCCVFVWRYKRIVCKKCKLTIREAFFKDLPAICHSRRPQNVDSAEFRPQDSPDGPDTPMVENGDSKKFRPQDSPDEPAAEFRPHNSPDGPDTPMVKNGDSKTEFRPQDSPDESAAEFRPHDSPDGPDTPMVKNGDSKIDSAEFRPQDSPDEPAAEFRPHDSPDGPDTPMVKNGDSKSNEFRQQDSPDEPAAEFRPHDSPDGPDTPMVKNGDSKKFRQQDSPDEPAAEFRPHDSPDGPYIPMVKNGNFKSDGLLHSK